MLYVPIAYNRRPSLQLIKKQRKKFDTLNVASIFSKEESVERYYKEKKYYQACVASEFALKTTSNDYSLKQLTFDISGKSKNPFDLFIKQLSEQDQYKSCFHRLFWLHQNSSVYRQLLIGDVVCQIPRDYDQYGDPNVVIPEEITNEYTLPIFIETIECIFASDDYDIFAVPEKFSSVEYALKELGYDVDYQQIE